MPALPHFNRLPRATYDDIDPAEVTPERIYRNRRTFMRLGTLGAGLAAGAALLAGCGDLSGIAAPSSGPAEAGQAPQAGSSRDELNDELNTYEQITTYNNYYEFSLEKEEPAKLAKGFTTTPWSVQVGGLVNKPQTYTMDELVQKFVPDERIYRLRCVEAWSMVIPWQGFPLKKLLEDVEPTSKAKYVRFETVRRPNEMPGISRGAFPWPYVEGLRLDEAMNDLTLMATGLYGKPLPPQNGAPLRLAVPWKYGFKWGKSIVKIDLVESEFQTFWMKSGPGEYGFYANVNPEVPHPRWSQSSERRIGEVRRRRTLPFNGYADQVSKLYQGMDLRKSF
ncbi:MAG: Protein-methionine-sulfoxide reductase catalytic subunit MsrP [uncultured Chloroflexi bacterium]|uniref:Protein-methionine-sulfoxide reductase catalytic subunit MsrP n=1 Tax=uncultured Chloroflexota bacterium TaxID=166587 RepID=A0A6J4H0S8_9CHLR|nr:MAG: Protein-methionine-sulfoxide reductase catalytic subunit MsrP [uncultured Chloroflexota bacterium]